MSERNKDVPHQTEDKEWWLGHGEKLEECFVALCANKRFLNAIINPEKIKNPTAPDLIVEGRLADLKTQNTPFFTSWQYGIDPRYAVTFNKKDFDRYRDLYPEIIIYFWINWLQVEWKGVKVEPFNGIFRLPFSEIAKMIEGGTPEHVYRNRKNDTGGNAKSSYVFDVRKFEAIAIVEGQFLSESEFHQVPVSPNNAGCEGGASFS